MVDPFKEYLSVGFVQRAHGLKGEVILDLRWVLRDPDHLTIDLDGSRVPFKLEGYVSVDRKAYVKFAGVDCFSDTELIKGKKLFAHEMFVPEGEVIFQRLLNYEVIDAREGGLGRVTSISNMPLQKLIHIERGNGLEELLVPYHMDIVKSVDYENEKIFLHLPTGFLET